MSNDAKLGLVLGVAIVLLIALVFFRNDELGAQGSLAGRASERIQLDPSLARPANMSAQAR